MLTDFWSSPQWHAYERATGDAPGTRARLLASATWLTRVLDLTPDEATLWADVRQSYHALINRLERDPAFSIREALPREVVDIVRPLHAAIAGRVTRPRDSWRLQASWVLTGHARCWLALRDGVPVGFLYALTTPPCCAYYFSGGQLERSGVSHALMWHAIGQLKAAGVRWWELGWQDREGDTDKDRAIAFFKRGFGGQDVHLCDVYGRTLDHADVSDAAPVAGAR